MEPTLGQICKYVNAIEKDTTRSLQCNFYDPIEGKLGSFFTFRESEKTKKKTPWSTFFGDNLVGLKKG
jgi:hypothetical protein